MRHHKEIEVAYPRIPLAYVPFLSSLSKPRAALRSGPTHVTAAAHHDKNVRSVRFEIENQSHWNEMVAGTVALFNEGPVDTMLVLFPTSDEGVDAGYLIEGGKAPMFIEWTYAPDKPFTLMLIENPETIAILSRAEAFDTLKTLLDRIAGASAPEPLPGLGGAFTGPNVKFGSSPRKLGSS